jgi:hypothetical protein
VGAPAASDEVEKVADGEMETTCKETIMTYVKEFF